MLCAAVGTPSLPSPTGLFTACASLSFMAETNRRMDIGEAKFLILAIGA